MTRPDSIDPRRLRWLTAGLFCLTLATLLLETLDARLLSVLTWYHLSFFAVSLAMLGMAGGAVFVFLRPVRFSPERTPAALARVTLLFAASIPVSHLLSLSMPFLPLSTFTTMEVVSVLCSTVVLAAPFALSGVAVTLALTRTGGPIGRLYAADLIGAALGCLLVVPLLEQANVSSAVLAAGVAAAAGAACFHRFAPARGARLSLALAAILAAAAAVNHSTTGGLQVIYPKNQQLWLLNRINVIARWNSHSYVLVQRAYPREAFFWGPGKGAEQFKANLAWLVIDGEAGTPITQWNGDVSTLDWVSYDVTALPYSLRRGGDVAVIGVGGGRDVLAALWGRSRSIVGIDVNRIMIDLQTGSHRDFANIANRPEVRLVHDDGRAHLTRTRDRFDVIQMSLVDTWAATGAGAFSLSENGLYTLDAWRVFLDRLKPGGVLSVSRWFDPNNVSETSRLVSLGVAALLDRGVASPHDHLLLVVRDRVATLMLSTAPFTAADRAALTAISQDREFHVLAAPWIEPGPTQLDRIAASASREALARATADPIYDYSPPTDGRPYYFNMLKPRAITHLAELPREGAFGGNLRATVMLLVLLGIATVLVALLIIWPLARAGRPPMPASRFATTMVYFGIIGFAYMLVQIGLLQRFAVYLGHPTYTLAIVLFSMLLFTGLGSLWSERFAVGARGPFRWVPVAIASALAIVALALPAVIPATITAGIGVRSAIVLAFAAPLSMLLGLCFPFGARLTAPTPQVVAWAWGINGACGVLASILAVALSIWVQIDANFWTAAALYLLLTLPLRALARPLRP
jgi:SAM-dependent methyltransferase